MEIGAFKVRIILGNDGEEGMLEDIDVVDVNQIRVRRDLLELLLHQGGHAPLVCGIWRNLRNLVATVLADVAAGKQDGVDDVVCILNENAIRHGRVLDAANGGNGSGWSQRDCRKSIERTGPHGFPGIGDVINTNGIRCIPCPGNQREYQRVKSINRKIGHGRNEALVNQAVDVRHRILNIPRPLSLVLVVRAVDFDWAIIQPRHDDRLVIFRQAEIPSTGIHVDLILQRPPVPHVVQARENLIEHRDDAGCRRVTVIQREIRRKEAVDLSDGLHLLEMVFKIEKESMGQTIRKKIAKPLCWVGCRTVIGPK